MAIFVVSAFALILLLPVAHWAVWALMRPLSSHALAKTGQFVSVGGIETYYERYGSGLPLILIPPGGSHTSTWRFNIGALSSSHEVWTFDLPGSGYSEKPASFAYTHRSYAEFVREFMRVMEIPSAVLAGQSLGGTVALEFALDFPEQTAGLILIAAGGYSRGVTLGPLNPIVHRTTNAILMSFSSYPMTIRAFFRVLYQHPLPFQRDTELINEICRINCTANARSAYYWMQRALNFDFAIPDATRIKSVSAPTLILWAREDRVVGIRNADRFKNDIAGSQLVVVNDAGHMVHEEKPEEVNRAITAFLEVIGW